MYELKAWLWQFGRGKPRVGGLSVADTEDRQIAVLQDGARRGHAADQKKAQGGGQERQLQRRMIWTKHQRIYDAIYFHHRF